MDKTLDGAWLKSSGAQGNPVPSLPHFEKKRSFPTREVKTQLNAIGGTLGGTTVLCHNSVYDSLMLGARTYM